MTQPEVEIQYINWRGHWKMYHITPLEIWFGHTEWHKTDQYLLKAIDSEDGKTKDFAMSGLIVWGG